MEKTQKQIKCIECHMDAEYIDIDKEPLCESCAKDRAFNRAYNNHDFEALENISDKDH